MPRYDVREWLAKVEELGELKKINGAHWNLEIGAITELAHDPKGLTPAVLFDQIPDYPEGYRVLANELCSLKRLALSMGLRDGSAMDQLKQWREKIRDLKPIPPRFVDTAPVMENVHTGKDVDMFEFPSPLWHELDGGRYIGTAHSTITRDPDGGSVNFGTYRVMVHDRDTLGFFVSPGKHARIHREKCHEKGQPCNVAISFGHDPLLFGVSVLAIPYGVSEFDYAGGIRGEPIEVIRGPLTGLPIPATAEIVIEGESPPDEQRIEGPFGEFDGYYGSAERPEPIIKVKAVYHRYNPILCAAPALPPSTGTYYFQSVLRSAHIWEELEKAGVPDVLGVWAHPAGTSYFLIVVQVKQRYHGHARQAAVVASGCHTGAYLGRYVVVVDEDIDITDSEDVLWALCTRVDPVQDIDMLRRCWASPLDPIIPKGQPPLNSKAIIDACRPYEWIKEFPAVAESSPQLRKATLEKWGAILRGR